MAELRKINIYPIYGGKYKYSKLKNKKLIYSTNSTNVIIVLERPDLSWSRNSTSLQTGEIHSTMVTKWTLRVTVLALQDPMKYMS
jgi:hypothetical protein